MNQNARGRGTRTRAIFTAAVAASCLLLLFTYASASLNGPAPQSASKVTTVFLVRHAEKGDAPAEDPGLSESGKARAEELARMLGGAGVKAIYTSQFQRTKLTAEPLAKRLGLTAMPMTLKLSASNPREVSEQSVAEIVGKINEQAGGAVLVVGHSNSVPAVIKMLGGDVVPQIDEKKFDDLFVVTVYDKGKASVVQMKYGAKS